MEPAAARQKLEALLLRAVEKQDRLRTAPVHLHWSELARAYGKAFTAFNEAWSFQQDER